MIHCTKENVVQKNTISYKTGQWHKVDKALLSNQTMKREWTFFTKEYAWAFINTVIVALVSLMKATPFTKEQSSSFSDQPQRSDESLVTHTSPAGHWNT